MLFVGMNCLESHPAMHTPFRSVHQGLVDENSSGQRAQVRPLISLLTLSVLQTCTLTSTHFYMYMFACAGMLGLALTSTMPLASPSALMPREEGSFLCWWQTFSPWLCEWCCDVMMSSAVPLQCRASLHWASQLCQGVSHLQTQGQPVIHPDPGISFGQFNNWFAHNLTGREEGEKREPHSQATSLSVTHFCISHALVSFAWLAFC